MDDICESQPWPLRPETDLTETNAWIHNTEVPAARPPEATEQGVWIDPVNGPVMLP